MTSCTDILFRIGRNPGIRHRAVVPLLCLAAATGCAPVSDPDSRAPERGVETAQLPSPGSNGIITIGDNRAIVAMPGDTLSSISARAGLTPEQLAQFNGLSTNYHPRPGEVFALPPAGPTGRSVSDLAKIAESAIGQTDALLTEEPLQVIEPDDARQSQTTGAETVETETIEDPVVTDSAAQQDQSVKDAPVDVAKVPPAPENEDSATSTATGAVQVASSTTRDQFPETGGRLLVPVEGQIVRPYSGSAGGNHGIDFGVPAGTPVRASDDGSIVLVSPSETHTTIVLIRHDDDLYTVYSRITGVTLKKGDRVSRGQVVGQVVEGSPSLFHFQVRRGTESVDPVPLLRGETR